MCLLRRGVVNLDTNSAFMSNPSSTHCRFVISLGWSQIFFKTVSAHNGDFEVFNNWAESKQYPHVSAEPNSCHVAQYRVLTDFANFFCYFPEFSRRFQTKFPDKDESHIANFCQLNKLSYIFMEQIVYTAPTSPDTVSANHFIFAWMH